MLEANIYVKTQQLICWIIQAKVVALGNNGSHLGLVTAKKYSSHLSTKKKKKKALSRPGTVTWILDYGLPPTSQADVLTHAVCEGGWGRLRALFQEHHSLSYVLKLTGFPAAYISCRKRNAVLWTRVLTHSYTQLLIQEALTQWLQSTRPSARH